MESNILKISSKSNPSSVAGSLTAALKEYKKVELHAVGAGAVNQAVKAIAIARGFVAPQGEDLITVPAFMYVNVEDEERTGMKFIVRNRE